PYFSPSSSVIFSLLCSADHRYLHSFPTRRSSDLLEQTRQLTRTRLVDFAVTELNCARISGFKAAEQMQQRRLSRARCTANRDGRSEEHTSELQSPDHLVCRLLLEKKKKNTTIHIY